MLVFNIKSSLLPQSTENILNLQIKINFLFHAVAMTMWMKSGKRKVEINFIQAFTHDYIALHNPCPTEWTDDMEDQILSFDK